MCQLQMRASFVVNKRTSPPPANHLAPGPSAVWFPFQLCNDSTTCQDNKLNCLKKHGPHRQFIVKKINFIPQMDTGCPGVFHHHSFMRERESFTLQVQYTERIEVNNLDQSLFLIVLSLSCCE